MYRLVSSPLHTLGRPTTQSGERTHHTTELCLHVSVLARRPSTALPFASDSERWAQVEAEQLESIRMLREEGEREFDLPARFLPDQDDLAETLDDGIGAESRDVESLSPLATQTGGGEGGVSLNERDAAVDVSRGCFVFFDATPAPFLVGRVTDVLGNHEGEDVEVSVHWYNPARPRENPYSMNPREYGKGMSWKVLQDWRPTRTCA